MPASHRNISRRGRRTALLVAALTLTALVAVVARAPAQSASEKLEAKLDKLNSVNAQQVDVQASIEEQNARINELIGRESEVRRQEAAVQAEYDSVQAELDEATAKLNEEKAHLRKVKAHLDRAVAALEDLLVQVYKAGDEDTISIVLESASWSDLIARTQYLESVKNADDAVVDRVRELEDEIKDIVADLEVTRERIKEARDEVAARKQELEKTQAELAAQHAELAAAQDARRATLATLEDQQDVLEKDLSKAGVPTESGTILSNGDAVPPANAPLTVKAVIEAANRINDLPYVWGGGHGSFEDSGYDCSGAVSYALHGGGLLSSPLDSTGLEFWGEPGPGSWITVYATSGHTFAFIAGLRWDTGGNGGGFGPRWHTDLRDTTGYVARHPAGL